MSVGEFDDVRIRDVVYLHDVQRVVIHDKIVPGLCSLSATRPETDVSVLHAAMQTAHNTMMMCLIAFVMRRMSVLRC